MSAPSRLAVSVFVGITLNVSSPVQAETITLMPTKDNTLIEVTEGGPMSNGMGDGIYSGRVGITGNGTLRRAVLAFDIAGAIPAHAEITSVALTLGATSSSGGNQTQTLYRLTSDWGEGTSAYPGGLGAPATPNDATWVHTHFDTGLWSNEGGDYSPVGSAAQIVGAELGLFYTWGPTPRMLTDVQGWLSDPASNFGWIMIGNESQLGTAKRFGSKDHVVEDWRPVLTIEFVATSQCPADLDGDGEVGPNDLAMLLVAWGLCPAPCDDGDPADTCAADLGGDCEVGPNDLATLLVAWGPCP